MKTELPCLSAISSRLRQDGTRCFHRPRDAFQSPPNSSFELMCPPPPDGSALSFSPQELVWFALIENRRQPPARRRISRCHISASPECCQECCRAGQSTAPTLFCHCLIGGARVKEGGGYFGAGRGTQSGAVILPPLT